MEDGIHKPSSYVRNKDGNITKLDLDESNKLVNFWYERCSSDPEIVEANRSEVITQLPEYDLEDATQPLIVFMIFESEDEDFVPNINKIYDTIGTTQYILKEIYNKDYDETACVVCKTDEPYYRAGSYNHMIRLQFPFIRVTNLESFASDIEKEIIRELNYNDVYTVWEDLIIVNKSISVPILGCKYFSTYEKFVAVVPYGFEEFSDNIQTFEDLECSFRDSLLLFRDSDKLHYNFDKFYVMFNKLSIEEKMPIYLSLHWNSDYESIDEDIYNRTFLSQVDNTMSVYDLESAFIEAIDMRFRMSRFEDWILIGRALKTNMKKLKLEETDFLVSKNLSDKEALAKWEGYTEKYSKRFSPKDCVKHWKEFPFKDTISINTLAWFAKKDNYNKFIEIQNLWMIDDVYALTQSKLTDMKISTIFYKLNFLTILNDPFYSSGRWYVYRNNMWKLYETDLFIKTNLISRMISYIRRILNRLEADDKESEFLSLLENHSKISSMLKYARGMFSDYNFSNNADANVNILVLKNVTLECRNNTSTFRESIPEDFNTHVIDIRYEPVKDDNLLYQEFVNWMTQMYPDEGMFDYMMKLLASCLVGGNKLKMLPILVSGDSIEDNEVGNEGKTTLKTLISNLFGEYSVEPSFNAIASTKSTGDKPNPQLASLKNKRIAWFSEPPTNILIDDGLIKLMAGGGERINARKLFSNNSEFEVKCVSFFICNNIPQFSKVDTALKFRIKLIPHYSRWLHKKDLEKFTPEEIEEKRYYELDMNFNPKKYSNVAINLLARYYEIFCEEGLEEPEAIREFTDKYWDSLDPCRRWFNERVHLDDTSAKIKDITAYRDYREWTRSNQVNPQYLLRTYFEKSIKHVINTIDEAVVHEKPYYYGMRIEDTLF